MRPLKVKKNLLVFFFLLWRVTVVKKVIIIIMIIIIKKNIEQNESYSACQILAIHPVRRGRSARVRFSFRFGF